jgi:hypothetical protein
MAEGTIILTRQNERCMPEGVVGSPDPGPPSASHCRKKPRQGPRKEKKPTMQPSLREKIVRPSPLEWKP